MAKKRTKAKKHNQYSIRNSRIEWRRLVERGLFVFGIMVTISIAMGAYHKNKQLDYDLSVIGNGTATVVQVHDPSCQLCRRLKKT